MTRARRLLAEWAPSLAILVLGLVGWELAVNAFGIQKFLLPKPSEIASAFWDERSVLWPAGWYTFTEAFWGFVVGVSLGITAALVLARFRPLGSALMPYFVAASAIPIIAFAPIMNNWFGLLNPFSKMAIAAVLCFFPVMINTLRGLLNVDPSALELLRSYAAPERTVFRSLRVPNSLPFIFTALRVATTLATIGAIVSEYFAAPRGSLGQYIATQSAFLAFERSWAAIIFAAAIGIGLYLFVVGLERLVSPWARAQALSEQ